MMVSIKQQIYNILSGDAFLASLGFTWYGSEANDATLMPPSGSVTPPFGYLRFVDEFFAAPLDLRATVQVRLHDHERRQYVRINQAFARIQALLPMRADFRLVDTNTTEVWWFPEPGGLGPETEDPDRPEILLRVGEWVFRKAVGAALAAAG